LNVVRRAWISRGAVLYIVATVMLALCIVLCMASESRADVVYSQLTPTAAKASSLQGSSYPATNAIDANTSTRWSSAFSDPQWIYVDLGSSKDLSRVVLKWETAYGKSYSIQVSDDAQTWNTVYSTTAGDGAVDDITLPQGTKGRYVRMYGTARGTSWGYSLWEFEVYGASTTPPPDTTAPAAPTGLSGTPGDVQVTITWNANSESDLAGYNVYYSETSGVQGTKVNTSLIPKRTTQFTHTGLTNEKTCYYRVTAVDESNNESNPSSEAAVTPSGSTGGTVEKVSGSITGTVTWQSSKIYVVNGDLTVMAGATLNIQPGTIVKFVNGINFIINGTVSAPGTSSSRITFTSYRDDGVGGDTNGDGTATSPKPSDWSGFKLQAGSIVNLDQIVVKYAASGMTFDARPDHPYDSACFAKNLSLTNSELSYNNKGIYILGIQQATVKSCQIKNNSTFGMMIVHCDFSSIQNNNITGNGTTDVNSKVVEIDPKSLPNFKGNTLSNNTQNAVWIWDYATRPTDAPNQFSQTGADATLYGNTVYVLYGTTWVSQGTNLTIEPGTVVKGQPGAIVVQGSLSAQGTGQSPIIFTSYRDSSYGGKHYRRCIYS